MTAKKNSVPERPEQDELTTMMHAEFMEGEMTQLQMRCLGAWSRMRNKGETMESALKAYGLTEQEYRDNIETALKA